MTLPVTNEMLVDTFHLEQNLIQEPDGAEPLAAGFRDNGSNDGFRVFLGKRHPTSRRFALARLVGDHLCTESEDRVLPATDAKTERQKFQRAFAQAFLCPFDELKGFLGDEEPTDDNIEDAAAHFEVSPLLVKSTLVKRGERVPMDDLDDLEDLDDIDTEEEEVPPEYYGWWRIVRTSQWGRRDIDSLGTAVLSLTGEDDRLRMFALLAEVVCVPTPTGLHFAWYGAWEYDPVSGTGSVKLREDGRLIGVLRMKQGDRSTFLAERTDEPEEPVQDPPSYHDKWRGRY